MIKWKIEEETRIKTERRTVGKRSEYLVRMVDKKSMKKFRGSKEREQITESKTTKK